ncbi:hypothetical protein BLOT_006886 [Blomia tropicalis]|nr:hypothetical protein BLOT_006886 [Blomia tropicalis]
MTVEMNSDDGNKSVDEPNSLTTFPASSPTSQPSNTNNDNLPLPIMENSQKTSMAITEIIEKCSSPNEPNTKPNESELLTMDSASIQSTPVHQSAHLIVTTTQFPEQIFFVVEEAIKKPRWTISVIPYREFEHLLDISIEIIKSGQFHSNVTLSNNLELCKYFVNNTIHQFFLKFYCDEIIENIKSDIFL